MIRVIFINTFIINAALYAVVTSDVAWTAKATANSFTDLMEQDGSYFDSSYNDDVAWTAKTTANSFSDLVEQDNNYLNNNYNDSIIVPGCMDAKASNFNLKATEE